MVVAIAILLVAFGFLANTLFFSAENPVELKTIVPLGKIVSGGPPKDGIPSIDNPKFVKSDEAGRITDNDIVIGVSYEGRAKAYPLKILVWHEIVNDWFDDTPVAVTYCPLCYSSIAYIREVDGTAVKFGTSGRLYKNDLVMYDRQPGNNQLTPLGNDLTDAGNLWSQMLGQAIVGEKAGQKLTKIPADVMTWQNWRKLHPETTVLSTETGFTKPYGTDPYGDYYTTEGTLFPIENVDKRLSQKEIVLGIVYNEEHKAYPVEEISAKQVVNDILQDRGIVLFHVGEKTVIAFESDVNGQRFAFEIENGRFIDQQTNSIWNVHGMAVDGPLKGTVLERAQAHTAFWFAWADFHPTTDVYE